MTEHAKAPEKAAEIIEKVEKGKELTPAEQRQYDKVMDQANEERAYEEYTPGDMPGRTFYRVLESPSHTFERENDAIRFVAGMRLTRNLTAS